MRTIEILENVIQEYSWGSYTEIAKLLGRPTPSAHPQAELWMGAHASAPSSITQNGNHIPLNRLIALHPEEVLGTPVTRKFGDVLPFLFKVLAAEKPLSIQVHPDKTQARQGFETENLLKIPLNSRERNYKDMNHKPECICAITEFWALNGFRPIHDIVSFMEDLSGPLLSDEVSYLKNNVNENGLKRFFESFMTASINKKAKLIAEVIQHADKRTKEDPVFYWIMELYREYGNDIGVLSPLLLNLICLKPAQAMFLSSGDLHAYLKGTGIELMANSDNVIRGGLTSKHIDLSELLKIVRFEEKQIEMLPHKFGQTGETFYPCAAKEFILSNILVKQGLDYMSAEVRSIEILICIDGEATIEDMDAGETIIFKKGISVCIPAVVNRYTIKGDAVLYKASVPFK